jgi:hypothetical protein
MTEGEMGRACCMHGRYEKCITIWSVILQGRNYLEDLGIDGGIIFNRILEKQDEKVWTG